MRAPATVSAKAEPMEPACRPGVSARERSKNGAMKRTPITCGGTQAKVSRTCGSVFAGWSSWDAPMRTTTTSSFAGSGDREVGHESLVISLLFSLLFPVLACSGSCNFGLCHCWYSLFCRFWMSPRPLYRDLQAGQRCLCITANFHGRGLRWVISLGGDRGRGASLCPRTSDRVAITWSRRRKSVPGTIA